ncbi:MAG TPA: coenzyme F420-0:L-glutamate ligase [Candidatus Dormibacteraeota bacterium]
MTGVQLLPVEGMPEVAPGDDLARLILDRCSPRAGDILVVAQKVVSKAEGRIRRLGEIKPSARARRLAKKIDHDPRLVQAILDESARIVRAERILIVETHEGYVCANAGVDHSNVPGEDAVSLLPLDCDASAERLREGIRRLAGVEVGVIVSDTFGRAWRIGIENVALGVAGAPVFADYRGQLDDHGKEMSVTVVAVADELAAAAELVMGKTARVPAVIVRGYHPEGPPGRGRELVRPAELDLFR